MRFAAAVMQKFPGFLTPEGKKKTKKGRHKKELGNVSISA